jgi:hypothetical protein
LGGKIFTVLHRRVFGFLTLRLRFILRKLLAGWSSSFFVLKQRKKQRKFKKNAIASGSFFRPAPLQGLSVWRFTF